MGLDWDFLAAAQANDEAHQKKQRLKQVKDKKLEDKSKIRKVWWEDECGPIYVVNRIVIPRHTKLNGDKWVAPMD